MSTTTSYPQLLRRILALLTAVVLVSWGTAALSPADADSGPQPCTEGTGWIEVQVNSTTYTYTAPEGQVITEACAKGPNAFEPVFFSPGGVDSFTFDAAEYGWVNDNGEVQQISHIGVKLADAPDEGDGEVCEEGPNAGQPIPPGETEETFCHAPGGDNPGGNTPGGNTPGGNTPGGNTPGGDDAGGTEVLGAQASIGAGAPSGAGSSAPSAGTPQVPTAVNAGIEDPDSAYTGLRNALALLMVGFGLFMMGIALKPSRRTAPRHRNN
jgi:hypothetical protein